MTVAVDLTVRGDVRRLRLGPDDRIVVTIERDVSEKFLEAVRDAIVAEFPNNRVILLSPGLTLSVEEDERALALPPPGPEHEVDRGWPSRRPKERTR